MYIAPTPPSPDARYTCVSVDVQMRIHTHGPCTWYRFIGAYVYYYYAPWGGGGGGGSTHRQNVNKRRWGCSVFNRCFGERRDLLPCVPGTPSIGKSARRRTRRVLSRRWGKTGSVGSGARYPLFSRRVDRSERSDRF